MQKRCLIFIVMSFCLCAAAVRAQETGQVVVSLNDAYIREWLILGPFRPDDLDKDFLADMGGEANVQPKEGETIVTADSRALTWKRHKSESNTIDLLNVVGEHEKATAYAFCILKSEIAGEARIYVGSDDGIAIWINGKQVHNHSIGRALRLDQDMCKANLKVGDNRCLVKVSQGTEAWGFAMRVDMKPPNYAIVSGLITDGAGKPIPYASVHLEQDGQRIAQTWTDESGSYHLDIYPARGHYDLSATKGERGGWQFSTPLREGQHRTLNLTLRKAISIEGTLLMLDDKTPHTAVVVQAIRSGKVMATALSDEDGKYKLVNLRSGRYQVRCYTLDGYVYYTGAGARRAVTLRVERGRTIRNIDCRFAPFKKGTWKNYDTLDGLAHNAVRKICRDLDGRMWFGTEGGGVSCYDGKEFINFSTQDGLAGNCVWDIYCDPDGVMWFGINGGGVSRYDGKKFVNFTIKDGLGSNNVHAIYRDPDGIMWFGAWDGGLSRYDGKEFVNFTVKDGLVDGTLVSICGASDGIMWLGTAGGVSRYDGKEFVNFTPKDGLVGNKVYVIHRDPDGVMWFGTWGGGVSRYDGKEFVNFSTQDGLPSNSVWDIYRDPDGVMWFATSGGVSRYDGKGFVNFTTEDGLANNVVNAIYRDPDGVLWFGTGNVITYQRGGVSRYDGKSFTNFTTKDGLVNNGAYSIYGDPDGTIWISMWIDGGGVLRYDGKEFVNFTTEDGLADNFVADIYRDPDGVMWFGTSKGVSRYDGKEFVNFTKKDGLVDNLILSIYRDPDGMMWFGTWRGVSRYDGIEFVNLTVKDGLPHNHVFAIHRDSQGVMWFGTSQLFGEGSLSRYDGKEFVNFTTKDGLANDQIAVIYPDPDGVLWLGTWGGVSLYDGAKFVNLTVKDGLAHNVVFAIHRDSVGDMWFGTDGGGVSRYDGTAWTSFDTRDGLAGKSVSSIYEDVGGGLWFATDRGISRYHRNTTPPRVRIVSVTTDQTYRDLADIPEFAVGTRVTIEYSSIDFKTLPEKRQYRYRIKELDSDWRKPTKAASFDYTFKKPGTYTFEVQAIDRDLNYSDPASVSIVISAPPFYRTGIFLIALSIVGGGSLIGIIILGVQRWRSSNAEKLRLQSELEDAHQMQVGLLPESAPSVEGFDIAGFSRPAREVGGDFFDYIPLAEGKIGIAIADVSDKGLKGAMDAVLTNAMLRETAKNGASCGEILSALNADLYPRIRKQMFTALGFAILGNETLQWANAAQPYPMVRRGERVFEFKSDGELPLGMKQDVVYPDWELDLQGGDVVIFYTDGIIEAETESGRMYGIDQLEHTIRNINMAMDAAEIIETILQDVAGFVQNAEQYDDITVVVVKKL